MTTRRSFLQNLSVGIAGALLAANLELGYKPVAQPKFDTDFDALTLTDVPKFPCESLERTLYNVTFRMEHVKLWRDIPKEPLAYNTVDEYSRVASGMPPWRPPLKQRIREFFFGKPKVTFKALKLDHDPLVMYRD